MHFYSQIFHAQLWLPFIGACVGLPALVFLCWLLSRSWPRLSRLQRMTLFIALGFGNLAYALGVYAFFVEPNLLVVHRATIVSESWRGPPLTIAAIGDTHVRSPHVSARRVGHIVARTNALKPDLVVLLGDYMNTYAPAASRSPESRAEIDNALATFGALDARYGAVSALGNRDIRYGRTVVMEALERAGIAVLWNRHAVIARANGRFVIVGLADAREGRPDFAHAIEGAPEGADTIVVMHSPESFPAIPDNVALTLAGHTHCGQVTIPLIGRPFARSPPGRRYACHLVDEGGRKMFITSGIGTSAVPARLFNPPEIALITLKGAE